MLTVDTMADVVAAVFAGQLVCLRQIVEQLEPDDRASNLQVSLRPRQTEKEIAMLGLARMFRYLLVSGLTLSKTRSPSQMYQTGQTWGR